MIQMGLLKGSSQGSRLGQRCLPDFVDQRIDEALQRIGVARTEDVESLTQRLELLEQKVNG